MIQHIIKPKQNLICYTRASQSGFGRVDDAGFFCFNLNDPCISHHKNTQDKLSRILCTEIYFFYIFSFLVWTGDCNICIWTLPLALYIVIKLFSISSTIALVFYFWLGCLQYTGTWLMAYVYNAKTKREEYIYM